MVCSTTVTASCNVTSFFCFDAGFVVNCLTSQTTALCIREPRVEGNDFLSFIWPKTLVHSDGYCQCYPDLFQFADCLLSCDSIYQFSSSGNQVCLHANSINRILQRREELKVYFVATRNGPSNTFHVFSFYGHSINGKSKEISATFQSKAL